MRSPEGGAAKAGNLRRTHEYMNLPLCKQLSFDILAFFWLARKHIISKGNVGIYRIGELLWHNTLGFFCWREIPQNTHRNKRRVVV